MVTFISALKENKMLVSLVSLRNWKKKGMEGGMEGGRELVHAQIRAMGIQAHILFLTKTPKGVLPPWSPLTMIRDTALSFHNPLRILLLVSSTKFPASPYKTYHFSNSKCWKQFSIFHSYIHTCIMERPEFKFCSLSLGFPLL